MPFGRPPPTIYPPVHGNGGFGRPANGNKVKLTANGRISRQRAAEQQREQQRVSRERATEQDRVRRERANKREHASREGASNSYHNQPSNSRQQAGSLNHGASAAAGTRQVGNTGTTDWGTGGRYDAHSLGNTKPSGKTWYSRN